MNREILRQLANTTLLSEPDVFRNPTGVLPSIETLVMELLIGVMDCEAAVRSDPKSTWNERRLGRQSLAIGFLLAIMATNDDFTSPSKTEANT